jgi:hypothetical protein
MCPRRCASGAERSNREICSPDPAPWACAGRSWTLPNSIEIATIFISPVVATDLAPVINSSTSLIGWPCDTSRRFAGDDFITDRTQTGLPSHATYICQSENVVRPLAPFAPADGVISEKIALVRSANERRRMATLHPDVRAGTDVDRADAALVTAARHQPQKGSA